jgi:NAD-dependent SIR2 family protein deacetylase
VHAANTWGHCRACARWFRCSGWFDTLAPQPVCPDCGAEPSTIVVRDESAEERRRTLIEGQCPRCHAWFDAEDWFDSDKPVPVCPDCALVPCKLAYVDVVGHRTERVLSIELAGSEQWLG